MLISIIVAADENNAIGINNNLPWHLPVDLKYFKQRTTGHSIIMGRKTFESIGKALPNRINRVVSRNTIALEGILGYNSLETAVADCFKANENECFIIGGGQIYNEAMKGIVNKVYLTRVHTKLVKADTFFPVLDAQNWKLMESTFVAKDEKNNFDCSFEVYIKTTDR
jgi:dihydrofolate reductase